MVNARPNGVRACKSASCHEQLTGPHTDIKLDVKDLKDQQDIKDGARYVLLVLSTFSKHIKGAQNAVTAKDSHVYLNGVQLFTRQLALCLIP